jgi:hypothetical protein
VRVGASGRCRTSFRACDGFRVVGGVPAPIQPASTSWSMLYENVETFF